MAATAGFSSPLITRSGTKSNVTPRNSFGRLAAGCWVLGVGEAVAGERHPRLRLVPTLQGTTLESLGRDGVQDP